MIGHNSTAAAMLGDFIHDIEALEEQKREIVDRIKARKADAKSHGFDLKVLNQMLRERRLTTAERSEFQSLCEVYRAALGMLDGTPLGESARRRLMGADTPPEGEAADDAPAPEEGAPDLEGAREAGRQAARDGLRVIDNPFIAGDPRRAAWDEGWCAATGSDGMDIPEAWRRKPKEKPAEAEGAEEPAAGDADDQSNNNEPPEGETNGGNDDDAE